MKMGAEESSAAMNRLRPVIAASISPVALRGDAVALVNLGGVGEIVGLLWHAGVRITIPRNMSPRRPVTASCK